MALSPNSQSSTLAQPYRLVSSSAVASKLAGLSSQTTRQSSLFQLNSSSTEETRLQVCTIGWFALRAVLRLLLGPVLTIKVHSPAENIIGIKLQNLVDSHDSPAFELFPDGNPKPPHVSISQTKDDLSLTSGELKATVTTKPYSISFTTDTEKLLTSAGPKHQGVFDVPTKWTAMSASKTSCTATDAASNPLPSQEPAMVRYINSELSLAPGELLYGGGELFTPFVKNGVCPRVIEAVSRCPRTGR